MEAKINFSGYYKSPVIFEKYDQKLFFYYLNFGRDSTVQLGFLSDQNEFTIIGSGQFLIQERTVIFTLKKSIDGFESQWNSTILGDSIHFQIANPDFEDMPGEYRLIHKK